MNADIPSHRSVFILFVFIIHSHSHSPCFSKIYWIALTAAGGVHFKQNLNFLPISSHYHSLSFICLYPNIFPEQFFKPPQFPPLEFGAFLFAFHQVYSPIFWPISIISFPSPPLSLPFFSFFLNSFYCCWWSFLLLGLTNPSSSSSSSSSHFPPHLLSWPFSGSLARGGGQLQFTPSPLCLSFAPSPPPISSHFLPISIELPLCPLPLLSIPSCPRGSFDCISHPPQIEGH